ncbi:DNA polymerase alpha/epsilon subunit B-domain-containing protein [Sphaerosporella brunnea]|uniref:DNA polymerase epsilon subunit B n=1 Tax=Sphaerosporella brunnea TaxID=1250544 RepID=A0A5J5EM74_9PEZI|nr:DNA polymerase alpha/epsilon subunit B-domain-containing protein [Sphaerosporella brunnea]KAA8895788.1 DNA polymerase alpha/epsilon subunit B-domain-containing protein [Sphaerosporella brunnea]
MPPQLPQNKPAKSTLSSFLRRPPPAPPPSSELTSDPFVPLPPSSIRHSPAPAPRVLAVEIPLSILRPIAFRVFTKKHNLTLKSDALALLCQFVGRKCGADWRDSGAGEKLLDEIARRWKRAEAAGKILVDGGDSLKSVLKSFDVPTAANSPALSRTNSNLSAMELAGDIPSSMLMAGGTGDVEMSMPEEARDEIEDNVDPNDFLKIVDAFEMPKTVYNVSKKMFERGQKPSFFPPPSAKTALFRARYNTLYSRLQRNESFLAPTYSKSAPSGAPKSHYKLTPISALLGRAGQNFMLFGMLGHSPSGHLSLYDPTGEIALDMSLAQLLPHADANWVCPGMFMVLDGVYEEDGRFTVFTLLSPPPERREQSADVFGHVDFLGNGVSLDMSHLTHGGPQGRTMRRIEEALSHVRWVAVGELHLDVPRTLEALRHLFTRYSSDPPLVFILAGSFSSIPVTPGDAPSVRVYKENFDALASLLADFPSICAQSTLLFVPGDNDPWASTFSGGSASAWPRKGVPEVFLNRVKRVVSDVRCASNPCRLGYFTSEVVVCRDDVAGRFQRSAIRFSKARSAEEMDLDGHDTPPPVVDTDTKLVRKLVKTLLDQGTLSPFPLSKRPVLWDFAAHALALYPLPTALFLIEPNIHPFAVTYESCHVMNPGRFLVRHRASWVEYAPAERKGVVFEEGF